MIGFDEHRGNTLIVEDGKLAGRVAEPILGREAKLATLVELRERLGSRRTTRSRPATARTISR
jgi:phosphoserine phosphatase